MHTACPTCPCTQEHPAHSLLAALREDDFDAALSLGLLDAQPCPSCAPTCNTRLLEARDARRVALAARDRHRARALRLARIKAEREAARRTTQSPQTASGNDQPAPVAANLPKAASDALAKALARARERHS